MSELSELPEHLKDVMPTERKSMWRTAEERRMSDLTRVLEWLERRQGKKKQALTKQTLKVETVPKANKKEEKKIKGILKKQGEDYQAVTSSEQASGQSSKKDEDTIIYQKPYGVEKKGKRISIVPGNYGKEGSRKSDLDIKDVIALESTLRPNPYRRQSTVLDPNQQENVFNKRTALLRDWSGKTADTAYERKLKSLMEKTPESKTETMKMLRPEEVLSCRYLRLSKNNIRTLLKLCKDAGLTVDIHPHMVEGDIDAKKVFAQISNVVPLMSSRGSPSNAPQVALQT
ncbi:uncharacterized protein C16orf78 homolog [Carlito syrichta]|uniref:Uncharacterized protein C16orf78 homolog n=1 Tax=Carlito syrichta TaxID=1868482 RepID=A0A1U7TYK5_CARSF|nr:uncharacterized protein C16orf78 homolog [Carlito syrichta]